MKKSYNEMIRYQGFLDRFNYLKLHGVVGEETFGSHRYLNQQFYTSKVWRQFRNQIIARDMGCDLADPDRPIDDIVIHHINPITIEDILSGSDSVLDPNNAVCVSKMTHKALHYGDSNLLVLDQPERSPNDTCPWRK